MGEGGAKKNNMHYTKKFGEVRHILIQKKGGQVYVVKK
jgi:hypothetical protein